MDVTALFPVLVVVLLAAGVAAVLRPVRTAGSATPSEAWIAAEQHARRTSATAWAILLTAALVVAIAVGSYLHGLVAGLVLAATPALAGLAFLGVHLVGEHTWPRPDGAVRRAPLARRRVRDITPRGLGWLTGTWFVVLVVLLALCAAAAGTGGRSLSYAQADGSVSTASPFPGWYYGRVIVPLVLLLALGCLGTLVLVARRAAVADTAPQDDLVLRRTSARRVLAGAQLVVAWSLVGCLFFAANAVRGVQPRWADAFGPGTAVPVAACATLIAVAVAVVAPVVAVRGSVARDRRTYGDPLPRPSRVAA
jgi:hypothetical protein